MRHLLLPYFDRAPARHARATVAAKTLVPAVALGLLAAALSGCSTAPSAASVNGQTISQEQLAEQLHVLASDPAYVKAQDDAFFEEYEEETQNGEQAPELTVEAPFGSGPAIYGMTWTSLVLTDMITALAVEEHVAKEGQSPTATELAAAWASEYAANPTEWQDLTPGARTAGALYDADHALVEGAARNSATTDTQFYRAHSSYFWSRVCLTVVDVPVSSSGPGAARAQAASIASELSGHGAQGAPAVLGANLYCDSPEQLIEQPAAFRKVVSGLNPGHSAVLPESYEDQVVEVRSRAAVAFDSQVAGDIDIVATDGGSQALPASDSKVIAVLLGSHIKVNPAYGSWSTSIPAPCPPEILPLEGGSLCSSSS